MYLSKKIKHFLLFLPQIRCFSNLLMFYDYNTTYVFSCSCVTFFFGVAAHSPNPSARDAQNYFFNPIFLVFSQFCFMAYNKY